MTVATADASTEKRRSFIYEPYNEIVDGGQALFHFDSPGSKTNDNEIDRFADSNESDSDEDLLLDDIPLESEGSPAPVLPTAPVPMKALVPDNKGGVLPFWSGKLIWEPNGRFGGGVRFDNDSRIGFSEKPWFVEFWLKPELPSQGDATLVSVPEQGFFAKVNATGNLFLEWNGKRFPVKDAQLTSKRWVHIGVGYRNDYTSVAIYVNGNIKLSLERDKDYTNRQLHDLLVAKSPLIVGAPDADIPGIRGILDELRVNRPWPEYYETDLAWVNSDRVYPVHEGQPWFRDKDDLLLHLDFNARLQARVAPTGTLSPKEFNGESLVGLSTAAIYSDGVEKQALCVGEKTASISYDTTAILAPDNGTLSLWIRPANWDNLRQWNRFAKFSKSEIPLLTFRQGEDTHASLWLMKTPDSDAYSMPHTISPGTWTHITLTWNAKDTRLYVNGDYWPHAELIKWKRKGEWKANAPTLITFGGDTHAITLLDDLRIYRRPLSLTEIRNLTALYDERKTVIQLPAVELTFTYNGLRGHVDATVVPLLAEYDKAAAFRLDLRSATENTLLGTCGTTALGIDVNTPLNIRTKPFGFGAYELVGTALDANGEELGSSATTFSRVPPPWWQTTLGKSDKVMPDWTPVTAKGNTLGVSLREITFSDSGLPIQILSAGEPVLAEPISLKAQAGGKPLSLTPVKDAFQTKTKGEVQIDFKGAMESETIRVSTTGRLEFDGFMWFTVTLAPRQEGGSEKLDDLELRIPYTDASAKLMHWWSGSIPFRSRRANWIGAVPTTEGVIFRSNDRENVKAIPPFWHFEGSFIPYMLLTGNKRGMAWFAENDQGWTQSMEHPAVRLERNGEQVDLVLHIISQPVELDGPRSFSFGLQPTPVKKEEPSRRMVPWWGVSVYGFGGDLKGPSASYSMYRHPLGMDWSIPEKMRAKGRELEGMAAGHFMRQHGRRPEGRERSVHGIYYDQFTIPAFPDHSREWGEQWFTHRVYTPEIVDFNTWLWDEWLKRGVVLGMYMDDTFNDPRPRKYDDGLYMAYRLPNGKIQTGFSWIGQREQLKRMRQANYDRGLLPHFCAHATHTMYIPYMSFYDVILDGEDFYQSNPTGKTDFMDHWSRERLQFNDPAKWGLVMTWLGWANAIKWGAQYPEVVYRRDRAYAGALLSHDLYWGVQEPNMIDWTWVREAKICLDPDTEFAPYWTGNAVGTPTHPDITISAWKRPGVCAVVVANWGQERQEADIRMDLEKMGFPANSRLSVRDVDSTLLRYFDDELAGNSTPDSLSSSLVDSGDDAEEMEVDLELNQDRRLTPEQILEKRRANDPDGAYTWSNGILRCPVRRHDFRLFLFALPKK